MRFKAMSDKATLAANISPENEDLLQELSAELNLILFVQN
jgi:hypothetical protein